MTWKVAYLYDEDGRPYAGVYTAGTASPVTFLVATTDRGDIVALTNTAGAVFARYTYEPYGAVLSLTSSAVTGITPDVAAAIAARQPLRSAAYAYDAHSATYYLSQRHYDPATMRFLTKDPARDDGEESAYQYCAGDPVGKVDPTGLYSVRFAFPKGPVDGTRDLKEVLKVNAGYARKKRVWLPNKWTYAVDPWWFRSMVGHNKPWDLKRVAPATARFSKALKFNGAMISAEDFGNIHYGYVGRAHGFPLWVLRAGSVWANGTNVKLSNEFSDQRRIKQGFELFGNWGATVRSSRQVDRYVK